MKDHSHMDYDNPTKSGQRAFLRGLSLEDNPVDPRTGANARLLWNVGFVKQSKIGCKGIDLGDGNFSGCTQTDGDCPVCGL